MKINRETLYQLIGNKLYKAGLKREHAATAAEVLVYADTRDIYSHSAIRVKYYAERVPGGGTNHESTSRFGDIGPYTAISHADSAAGQVVAKIDMRHAIEVAKKNDVVVIGISRMGHSGTVSYFMQQAVRVGLVDFSIYQSDLMVVSLGGTDIYYGTNPLVFVASGEGDDVMTFDMVTTVQAQGKVPNARSRNELIFDTWAVDKNGAPTTDSFAINALLSATGSKDYGLITVTDVLSGTLLGLPFGRQVSSMYEDLHAGHNLGQLHMVINPGFFSPSQLFCQHLSQTMQELNAVTPTPGPKQVYYPGQDQDISQCNITVHGVDIVDDIHQYLISGALYIKSYETKNPFA